MSERELVEVFRAKNGPQAHVISAALEAAGIEVVIEGDLLQGAVGEVPAGWSGAPRVLVKSHDVARAREIIAQGGAAVPVGSREADDLDACMACGAGMKEEDEKCPACGWSYKGGNTSQG